MASWGRPPARVPLRAAEVHVWRAALDLPAPSLWACARVLDADERARADRLHSAEHRRHFVAAHGFLRTVLGRHLALPPETIRFASGPHGKPVLVPPSGDETVRFNLSHSHGLALCAVARGREVGIDIERVRAEVAALGIAGRFFSPGEQTALRALPAAAVHPAFFRLWTCKEAYVKATGAGISRALRTIEVQLGARAPRLRAADDPHTQTRWSLRELWPARGYAAALAVEGRGWRLSCWRWPAP